MAIRQQEVKLVVVYDDEKMRTPDEWPWEQQLTVGGASAGGSFAVASVKTSASTLATEDQIEAFNER